MKANICVLLIGTLASSAVLAAPCNTSDLRGLAGCELNASLAAHDAQHAVPVELSTAAMAAIDTYYPTDQVADAFDETPFGDTATSGVSQQNMYDLQFSIPVVQ